jgi:hypothetical protein
MASCRQHANVGEDVLQQGRGTDPVFQRRRRIGFQRGKGQQILDQLLHAPRLLAGGMQVTGNFGRRGIRQCVLRRLDETQGHRQRCLQFVRDIGNEVAPHGGQLLQLGHVAHQQQGAPGGERRGLQLQDAPRIALGLELQRHAAMVGTVEVGQELGFAQQMGDAAAGIHRGLEPEADFRLQVHPLDGAVAVEDQHAVGQGFGGAAEAQQFLGGLLALGAGQASAPVQGFEGRAPGAAGAGGRRTQRTAGPMHQAQDHPQLAQEKEGKRAECQEAGAAFAIDEPAGDGGQQDQRQRRQQLGGNGPHCAENR